MSAGPGQSYGPYRVIRPLGSGGMGTVFLAEDSRLGRFVALKTFTRDDTAGTTGQHSGAEARDRMLHEARAVATLNHPNIAAVHDILELAEETVIVFEFVEGETLADRLRRGRLPVLDALRIGAQIADGLAAAHVRGIVHRDLKPGNVMITPDGRAKILDFGIARTTTLSEGATTLTTTTNVFAGTPAYAAPEQWLGDPVTPRTDIFSLGMVLYEMLGGRRPFEAHTRLEVMQLVLEAPRPNVRDLNAQVPPSVAALIGDALQRDPQKRPSTAIEVASVLRAIERDAPLSERARSETLPLARTKRPLAIVVTAVFIAAIAALIAALLWRAPGGSNAAAPVVAVLPLANATGTPTNDYIATGVAESLTTSLASMTGVIIVSRAAVAAAASRHPELAALARELGASYLVEGSVQLSGNRVRLSVNLVRPDRSVVWADSVEGLFNDIFALQSRLASTLARALSVQMSAADRARLALQPTANIDALAAYYRGRALLDRSDIKGNAEASLTEFEEALRLDPAFAVAHAARAEALWVRYGPANDPAIAEDAVVAATNALRLDPGNAQTRYSMALALFRTGRSIEAIEELQHALTLQPTHDDARRQLALILARQGRLEEAIAEYRKAIAIRPNYWGHHSALGVSLYQAARYDEAIEALKRAIELQPDNALPHQQLGTVYQVLGRNDEAVAAYERSNAIQPLAATYGNLGALYHIRGAYEKAVDAYRAAITLRPNAPVGYRNLGDAYRRLGREADAIAAYRQSIRFTEQLLQVNARNALTLGSLAVQRAKVGEHTLALARIREAETAAPNDVQVMFYAAVVHALAGRRDDALRQLRRAVDNGYSRTQIRDEEDFRTLSALPAFKALVAQPTSGGAKQ